MVKAAIKRWFWAFDEAAEEWLQAHNLLYLWQHLPLVLASWALFTCLSGASRHLGPLLFPSVFARLTAAEMRKLRLTWPHHIVSLVHAIIICVLAIHNLHLNELKTDRVFGYSERIARMVAVTSGYFLWDLKVSIHYWHLYGHAFLIHAVMALSSFVFSYSPFLMFYAPYFLLFELSTIFVNVHWFMGKFRLEGSRLQKINDAILVACYFVVRIVFGLGVTTFLARDIWREREEVSWLMAPIYAVCTVATNALNIYWFVKLVGQALGGVRARKNAVRQIDMSNVNTAPPPEGSTTGEEQERRRSVRTRPAGKSKRA